ncbi:hypothetical protein B0T20DRAFT_159065 [Sordaria brevicollis]|uniref:Uncharacterized protein n=1 Tax=Sordaria brevicollis TaxID=83679 RepID=A0AAE0PK56_SORBR|nr:hypothetical protein B0T20DRAFT_159065 [Sordaria brevicollis]
MRSQCRDIFSFVHMTVSCRPSRPHGRGKRGSNTRKKRRTQGVRGRNSSPCFLLWLVWLHNTTSMDPPSTAARHIQTGEFFVAFITAYPVGLDLTTESCGFFPSFCCHSGSISPIFSPIHPTHPSSVALFALLLLVSSANPHIRFSLIQHRSLRLVRCPSASSHHYPGYSSLAYLILSLFCRCEAFRRDLSRVFLITLKTQFPTSGIHSIVRLAANR